MNRFQARREARLRWGRRGHAERRGDKALVGWHVGARGIGPFFHVAGEGSSFAEAFAEVDRQWRRSERYHRAIREGGSCERCARRLTRQGRDSRRAAVWILGPGGHDELVCKECKDRDRFGEYLAMTATQYVLALRHAARPSTDAQLRHHNLLRADRLWDRLDGTDRGRCVRVLTRLGLRVHDHEFWEGAERPRWRPNERPTET